MPTKSSARWIADGDNMVKVLQASGYKTDLQYADDDIPNQLAQIENMVTKGDKVLVIASIDGTTLSNVLQKAADKRRQGHRLRPADQGSKNVDYYATFDNFQVGVLQADPIVDNLKLDDGQGPVQHRAVRRLAGRQQRVLLLQRRDVGAQALHRFRQAGRPAASRWAWTRSPRCAGTARSRRRAWTTCCRPTTPARTSTPCCRRTTACRSASCRRSRASATAGRRRRCRSSPARTRKCRRSSPSSRASSTTTIFKDTRDLAKVTAGMVDAVLGGKAAGDQRHQDVQQRRQGRAVVPAQAGAGGQVELAQC